MTDTFTDDNGKTYRWEEHNVIDGEMPEVLRGFEGRWERRELGVARWFRSFNPADGYDWPYITRIRIAREVEPEVADWAWERVTELGRASQFCKDNGPKWTPDRELPSTDAFARYIMQHEKAPVDPLLIEAREMFAERHEAGLHDLYWDAVLCKHGAASPAIHEGKFDKHGTLLILLSALRRGIEIGKGAEA